MGKEQGFLAVTSGSTSVLAGRQGLSSSLTVNLTREEHMLGALSHAHHYISTLKEMYMKVSIPVFILLYITHMLLLTVLYFSLILK